MTEVIRPATIRDLSDLAILLDIASGGLLNRQWTALARPGQSPLETGRERLRTRSDLPSYFANWQVVVADGEVAGGSSGYTVPDPYDSGDTSDLLPDYEPLLELEKRAAGTWHLIALAVFPAFRSRGYGRELIIASEEKARAQGCRAISITAESSNQIACRLYHSQGFSIFAQMPAVSNHETTANSDWLLLQKGLK